MEFAQPTFWKSAGSYDTLIFLEDEIRTVEIIHGRFCSSGRSGKEFRSRTLLLATGVVDILPKIDGLEKLFGKSAHHCPYCHGWECRGQPLAVLGSDRAAADLALELLLWSRDIVLCTQGCPVEKKLQAGLEARGILIESTPIRRCESEADQLTGIRFEDDGWLARSALFFSPQQAQKSELAEELGCKRREGCCLRCADDGGTHIRGLFLAGNASEGVQLAITAAAKGTMAAKAINELLLTEDGLTL